MTAPARWILAEDTGMVVRPTSTYLAMLPDGPLIILDEVASKILTHALATPAAEVTVAVAGAFGVDPTEVAQAVQSSLDRLAHLGLIRLDNDSGDDRVSEADGSAIGAE